MGIFIDLIRGGLLVGPISSGGGGGGSDSNIESNKLCESAVTVGDAVYNDGGTLKQALATDLTKSQVVGFVMAKSDTTHCNIQTGGFSSAVFSLLTIGQDYFLSHTTPGALQTSRPPSGFQYVSINLGMGFTSSRLAIQIADRMQLS